MQTSASMNVRIETCIRECFSRAWRLAYTLTRSTHDAEDVVQHACIVAARKAGQIPEHNLWPWFAKIVVYEARNYQRIKRRRSPALAPMEDVMLVDSDEPEPSVRAEQQELSARVFEVLDELPEEERESLILTYVSGHSYRETAAILDVDHSLVYQRVKQGLERLRSKLGAEEASVRASFSCLPLLIPSSGYEGALSAGLASAKATLAGTVGNLGATGNIAGGAIMVKKITAIVAVAVALCVGAVSGALGSDVLKSDTPVVRESHQELPLQSGSTQTTSSPADEATLAIIKRRSAELKQELDALLARQVRDAEIISSLRNDIAALQNTVAESARIAADPVTKDAIVFGGLDTNGAFDAVDWKQLGEVLHRFTRKAQSLREQYPDVSPKELRQLLGEDASGDMFSLLGTILTLVRSVPTSLPGLDCVVSHPMVMINLMAGHLNAGGCSLSEDQLRSLIGFGEAYVQDFTARRSHYNDQTMLLERIIDEVELRHTFMSKSRPVLTPTQIRVLGLDDVNGPAFTPFYAIDALFQSHADIRVIDPVQVPDLLKRDVQSRWELSVGVLESTTSVFETWAADLIAFGGADTLACAKAELKAMKEIVATNLPGQQSLDIMRGMETVIRLQLP